MSDSLPEGFAPEGYDAKTVKAFQPRDTVEVVPRTDREEKG
jgi:hypothetical protein